MLFETHILQLTSNKWIWKCDFVNHGYFSCDSNLDIMLRISTYVENLLTKKTEDGFEKTPTPKKWCLRLWSMELLEIKINQIVSYLSRLEIEYVSKCMVGVPMSKIFIDKEIKKKTSLRAYAFAFFFLRSIYITCILKSIEMICGDMQWA